MKRNKNILSYLMILIIIPCVIVLGVRVFDDRKYNFISMAIAVMGCIPFFMVFEGGKTNTKRIVVLAVLTSISVVGRIIFGFLPGVTPTAAIVIITGVYLGSETGFLCGALSAIVSNIFFGQGPWTPFQMFSWGIIGFIAGLPGLSKMLKSKVCVAFYGALSGIAYSILMDIWTVISLDGTFNITRYLAALITAIPYTVTYIISNVIFLVIAIKPIGMKIQRLKVKHGL